MLNNIDDNRNQSLRGRSLQSGEARQGACDAAELDDARGLVMKTFNDDDGIVTKDEFLRYCEGLSATIDGDRYFAEVMEMTWHPP